ncbi:MAG TPA: hypothetical protein VLJ37_04805 [bacterium]|nr:hypothetical protein [bacterium]
MRNATTLALFVLIASASACSSQRAPQDLAEAIESAASESPAAGEAHETVRETIIGPTKEENPFKGTDDGFVPPEELPVEEVPAAEVPAEENEGGNPSLADPASPTVNEAAGVSDTIFEPSENPGPVHVYVDGEIQYTAIDQISATAEPGETDEYTANTNVSTTYRAPESGGSAYQANYGVSANYSPNPNLGDYVGLRKTIVIRCVVLPCE